MLAVETLTVQERELIALWCSGEWTEDLAAIRWMRARPEAIKDLMIEFPPSCVVRSRVHLLIPGKNCFAIHTSMIEPTVEYPAGQIGVRDLEFELAAPDAPYTKAYCVPDDLEVVGYWKGWTPARTKEVLGR